jgi:hypothetical protein
MTSNSKQLIALAREFAARNGGPDERVDSLILRGTLAGPEEQAQWLAFAGTPPFPFERVQVYDPEISGDVGADEAYASDRTILITVTKPAQHGVAAFVFSAGFVAFLGRANPVAKMVSAELEPRAAFQARGLEVAPWDFEEAILDPAATIPINVRELVRDYVPAREIAEDISPWLISSMPAVSSPEFVAWRQLSARRLLGSLVNSASLDDGVIWFQASGPPRSRIRADESGIADAWNDLTACASWVFLSGADTEVRHIIFAVELARAYRPETPLSEVLCHALDSAKTTYEAHVQSASRETLKVLADLRKSVVDDTQLVTQRAQDLTGGLWRDLTISAAPFVLTIFADDKKPVSATLAAGFYFAAAAFIIVSFGLQVWVQSRFFNNQKKARTRWLQTLYVSLAPKERDEIGDAPVARAIADYENVRAVVAFIYILLACALSGFGVSALEKPPQSNALTAPAPKERTMPASGPQAAGAAAKHGPREMKLESHTTPNFGGDRSQ